MCQEMMKVVECMEDDSMHKKVGMPLVMQLATVVNIESVAQTTSGPKRGQKGSGIRTHPRTKELQQKRSCGMLPKSNVSTTTSQGTLPRTMKRNHTLICEPKCDSMTQINGHKGGQTHQGPHNKWNHNIDKQGGVGGHFGMQQGKVYEKLHNLHLRWH